MESIPPAIEPRGLKPAPLADAKGETSAALATAGGALLVCGACYLGATIGTVLRFPHVGTAILFPPYAVVTAALILSSPRRWWIYLLAGSVGSFWPHRAGGGAVSFVLMTEIANYARAILAASGVRRFGGGHGRLDTLRGMAAFMLFAVALGPLAGAFIGAGVVAIHHGAARYWVAWQPWLLSNVLTALTLLPIILIVVARARMGARGRNVRPRRLLEAGGLAVALLIVAGLVLLRPPAPDGSFSAALYALLPVLLWAAVRFGPAGTSASVLVIAVLTIAGTLGERGPFVTRSPTHDMLQLQLFLFVSSVPLLLLSALIQEQQRTAHALRVSHRRYRAVVEDQTELICRFGPDGALTFVNGACCRAWGRSPQELLGSDFGALVPAARDGGGLPVAGSLTPERPVASWELERAPEAGERRWEHWSVRALFDAGGAVVDYQAVGRDITESKRAEHQHDLLEAQRALAEALRETDRRKDEFLATLAHELRGPLAPITMAVELLRGLPSADEETDTAREIIRRQTAQLARLVDDLLDISRITSDTIQLRPETVDLGSVVASAIEANKPIIALRELVVATSLPAQPLAVRGDTARLAQVVSNLLHNAAKYTAAGGRIDLDARREEEEAVLRITDTGAGIPADMLERVFEPFTQVDRRRDGELGGLGLGLPLVARLVELHGGSVSAFSEGPGRGSTFVIRLPALVPADERPPVTGGEERGAAEAAATEVAAVAAAPAGTRAAATPATTPLQVLVVDDVADAAAMLARLLTQHGFSVKVAHNGRTALDMVDRFDPDVAFVDLMMPEVDGLEVARQVRGRSASARMLLVAVTGFGQPGDRHRALEAGFDHHLTKPIDLGTLLALLAEVPSRASRV